MISRPARGSYIRRKRHLNECAAMILRALQVIMPAQDASIHQVALLHARQVEAACSVMGMNVTDAEYQALMMTRAHRLCCKIMKPTVNDAQLRHPMVLLEPELRAREASAQLQYIEVVDATRLVDENFIGWAFAHELLPSLKQARNCTGCRPGESPCGAPMRVEYNPSYPDGAVWRCPVPGCRKKCSIRRDSLTFGSQLTLKQIAMLIASWCDRRSVDSAVKDSRVTETTVIAFYQGFRSKAEQAYRDDLVDHRLGRIGGVVQIDESHFHKAKYNLGSTMALAQVWFFGAIDCETNRVAMEICENRTAELLVSLIKSLCLAGCEIWSDKWKAYQGLELQGFVHGTVNHSRNYRDPVTGVHTNRIEGNWGAVKQFIRRLGAKSRDWTQSYVHEWCFRRNIGRDFETCWFTMVR